MIRDETTPWGYAYYVEFQVQPRYREFVADPGSYSRVDVYGRGIGLKRRGRIQSAFKEWPRGWAAHTIVVATPGTRIDIVGTAAFSPDPATNLQCNIFGCAYETISHAHQEFSCIAKLS